MCLSNGIGICTRTNFEVSFLPGEYFDLQNFEKKRIEQARKLYNDFSQIHNSSFNENEFKTKMVWSIVKNHCNLSALKKHWNWTTQEGKEFCTQLRKEMGCKKKVSTFEDRFKWPFFEETCKKFNVLHHGNGFTPE